MSITAVTYSYITAFRGEYLMIDTDADADADADAVAAQSNFKNDVKST